MEIEKLEKMQAEHEVHGPAETWREGVALFEIAIQLKRIADAMEKLIEKEIVIDGEVFGLANAAQPQAATEPGYKHGGLRQKYILQKTNGHPIDPNARYFVLRYDIDPHARRALNVYAESVRKDNLQLSTDLLNELTVTQPALAVGDDKKAGA